MDYLQHIIRGLKKEEVRNFKLFITRYKRKDDVKISILFDKIRSERYDENDKELVKMLFPDETESANSYYRLKNRMKTELEKSLLNLHNDLNEKISIINQLTLANIFFFKSNYPMCFHYLKKAEKLAQQTEAYDMLEVIYNDLIILSHKYNELNPLEYIEKRRKNAERTKVLQEANDAIAGISYKLRHGNVQKAGEDVAKTMERIMNELKIAQEIYHMPMVKFKIDFGIREMLLRRQNYPGLEQYLVRALNEFEAEGLFNKSTHRHKLTMLTWLVNSLLAQKKWELCEEYGHILYEELYKFNNLYYNNFIWTYHQARMSILMATNRLPEAIELLENIIHEETYKGTTFHDYAIHVNLALCYYYQHNYSQAIKTLLRLLIKEVYNKLSQEQQLALGVLEVVVHYEAGHLEFVGHKVTELRRTFRLLLRKEEFLEENAFLRIMNMIVNRADPFRDKRVLSAINRFLVISSDFEIENRRHIGFGLWLKSRLERTSYYELWLNKINPSRSIKAA